MLAKFIADGPNGLFRWWVGKEVLSPHRGNRRDELLSHDGARLRVLV